MYAVLQGLTLNKIAHLGALLLLIFSSNTKAYHWQSTDFIVNSFVDIALNNEYSGNTSRLRKWQSPIVYYIDHRTADKNLHQDLVETHLAHLESITNLAITPTTDPSKANLKIIFSKESQLAAELNQDFGLKDNKKINQLTTNSLCLAFIETSSNSNIRKASVVIPVDRARAYGKLISCVVEELTQIMGLPNDSEQVYPSVFNDKSHDDYLSGLDILLLKLLYDRRLKTGMNKSQLLTLLPNVIKESDFQQLILNAEVQAKNSGLAQLLN